MTVTTEKLEASKKLARDYIDQVFNQHNPAKAADFVTGDVVWHGGALGDITGAENLAGLLGSFIGALPDLHAAERDIIAENDLVVVRLVVTATVEGSLLGVPGRRQAGPVGRGGHLPGHRRQDQRGVGRRRHRDDYGPDRCLQPAVGCLTSPASNLWGSRTRPAGRPGWACRTARPRSHVRRLTWAAWRRPCWTRPCRRSGAGTQGCRRCLARNEVRRPRPRVM